MFRQELGYVASASYTTLSNAIAGWDFRHDGRALFAELTDARQLLKPTACRVRTPPGVAALFDASTRLRNIGAFPGLARDFFRQRPSE